MKKAISILTTIVLTVSMALCMCACSPKEGTLYSLYQAYENGLINKNDIKSIGYYISKMGYDVYEKYVDEDGVIRQKKINYSNDQKVLDLDSDVKSELCNKYYEIYNGNGSFGEWNNMSKESVIADLITVDYFGKYNGNYVVRVSSEYVQSETTAFCTYEIDMVTFIFPSPYIQVYSY